MGEDLRTSADLIEATTASVLRVAEDLRVRSVALPAFGTGVGGFPLDQCARLMVRVVRAHEARSVERVVFTVLGDEVYGTDAQTLPGVALAALYRAGVAKLASLESGTDGALLAILAAHEPAEDESRFMGGTLLVEGGWRSSGRVADGILVARLASPAALGRSRVTVSLDAPGIGFEDREVRIHGSGQQRLRRAGFAALDLVRRAAAETTKEGRA